MKRYLNQVAMNSHSLPMLALLGLLTTGLVGCGNGGSGDIQNLPAAPLLNLTPAAVKAFQFNWGDVDGETEYRLLEDPTGNSGYTQVASIDADATSHELVVSLPKRINARYILQACNNDGCSDSAAVHVSGPLLEAVGYVKASNTGANDTFANVALSGDGNTLAVGANREDSSTTGVGSSPNDSGADTGAVYVFIRNGSTWNEQAYIKASNTGDGDFFGQSVALSDDGNTLAVGAHFEDSNTTGVGSTPDDDGTADDSGAVYVFARSEGIWGEQAYVKASNTGAEDYFGYSVELSGDGNTLAVGAPFEDSSTTGVNSEPNDGATESGGVYVFTRSGVDWSQQAYIKAFNTGLEDRFGWTLALSENGNTLAVGAYREDSSSTGVGNTENDDASNSGAVYVFVRSSGIWGQQAFIKASNTGAEDYFGWSLALSADGNTLAVGAVYEDSSTTGVNSTSNDSSTDTGAVYVFIRSGVNWSQQAYVKASNTGADDWFGYAVALSGDGDTLAVGAIYEDSNTTGLGSMPNDEDDKTGAVYLFTRSDSTWNQQAYVKASNTGAEDWFGSAVALTGDGNTLAVGAPLEDSGTTGVGSIPNESAENAGAVYLY